MRQDLGREILGRAFSAKPGEVWQARAPTGLAVGRVENVRTDAGPTAARLAEENRGPLAQVLAREISEAARNYARNELKVRIGDVFYGTEGILAITSYTNWQTYFGPKLEPGPSGSG